MELGANGIMIFFVYRTQGKADQINIDQFINFLNEKQRDPRLNEILYPLYDEKRAVEILDTYEQDDQSKTNSKYRTIFFTKQTVD